MPLPASDDAMPTRPFPQQWLRPQVEGRWVAILNHRRESRAMQVTEWQTRAIRRGDIHELMTTPHPSAGGRVDLVYYLGFAEFGAGIIAVGDGIWTEGGELLGVIIGFDETHAPNHLNIVLESNSCLPGQQRGLMPSERLFVRKQDA